MKRWLVGVGFLGLAAMLPGCGVSASPSPGADPGASGRPSDVGDAGGGGVTGDGAGGAGATTAPGGASGAGGSIPTTADGGTSGATAHAGSGGAGAGAAGPGVMINGTFVPKNRVVVFIHLGQSNMAGRAQGPTPVSTANTALFYDQDPKMRAWVYERASDTSPTLQWRPAKGTPLLDDGDCDEPLNDPTVVGRTGAGPGPAWLKIALASQPAGADTYFVSICSARSGKLNGNCRAFLPGGIWYSKWAEPVKSLGNNVTWGPAFVTLGDTDAALPYATTGNGFLTCLQGLVDGIRAATGVPDLPFLAADYPRQSKAWLGGVAVSQAIDAQLQMLPATRPNTAIVSSTNMTAGDMQPDGDHFNMEGHKVWVANAFAIMRSKTSWSLPWLK